MKTVIKGLIVLSVFTLAGCHSIESWYNDHMHRGSYQRNANSPQYRNNPNQSSHVGYSPRRLDYPEDRRDFQNAGSAGMERKPSQSRQGF